MYISLLFGFENISKNIGKGDKGDESVAIKGRYIKGYFNSERDN